MSQPRVLVFERIDPTDESLDWLERQGMAVTRGRVMWEPGFRRYTEAEIVEEAAGYVAVMGASGAHFTRPVIEALPALRFISKFGIGVDSIDLAAATARGVRVSNTPVDTQVGPVCEHTIALMLALTKRLLDWTPQYMRAGGWRSDIFAGIVAGQTIGIVGLGRIGRGVAARLAGWDANADRLRPGTDRGAAGCHPVRPAGAAGAFGHRDVARDPFARQSPDDRRGGAGLDETDGAADQHRPCLAGRSSEALRHALETRQIAGAGIDVFETEPPDPADPLFRLPTLLATPHAAAWTLDGMKNMGWTGARNLWAMVSGEGAAHVVNP